MIFVSFYEKSCWLGFFGSFRNEPTLQKETEGTKMVTQPGDPLCTEGNEGNEELSFTSVISCETDRWVSTELRDLRFLL